MTDAYGASTPVGVHRSPLFTVSGVASVSLKCVTIRSFIPLGLLFHPYGTAVPCLWDYSLSHKRLRSPDCVAPRQGVLSS